MLLFSTLLSIRPGITKDDFIRLVIEWNQSNPHRENIVPNIEWHGERNIRWGDERMWLAVEEYRNENIVAIRYEKDENGVIWDSDYVLNFNEMKLSVRLDRSYTEDAPIFARGFSAPHFITTLITAGWLVPDGPLEIAREPFYIKEETASLLAGIINRTDRYRLPVVYVSHRSEGDYPLDLKLLASRLKGIAHVLADGELELSCALQRLTDNRNEYAGAVGIYYPGTDGNDRHVRHHNREYSGWDTELADTIVREITAYSIAQRLDPLYTWMGVSNALLRDRLDSQSEERMTAEAERDLTNQLMMSTDAEISGLKQRILELTRENERMLYENQGLRARLEASGSLPVLYYGREKNFYEDEIKNFLLVALEEARQNAVPKTRKSDVLNDIIAANGSADEATGVFREKAETLKRLFKGYSSMTGPMRQELKRLGFSITEEGKHYKLTYYGDGRYWSAVAKTPSDHRAGDNDSARLIRTIL